jgi:hypothetical protein
MKQVCRPQILSVLDFSEMVSSVQILYALAGSSFKCMFAKNHLFKPSNIVAAVTA